MVDRPSKWLGLTVAVGLLVALCATIFGLLYAAHVQPFGGQRVALHAIALVLVACTLWLALRTSRLASLQYTIGDGLLVVDMGLAQWQIPLDSIHSIGQPDGFHKRTWGWPGWNHAIITQDDNLRLYAASTLPERRSLLIKGDRWSLFVSPSDPTAFTHAVDQAQQIPSHERNIQHVSCGIAAWPVWKDRSTLYPLTFSLVNALLLYTAAAHIHPNLSRQIAVIGSGAAARMLAPQGAAQAMPAVAAVGATVNGILAILLHRYHAIFAHLLAYGTLVQQAILWIGLWQLMRI